MQQTIRVAMLTHNYYPLVGGSERQIMSLLPLLAERQIESIIVTRHYEGFSRYEDVNQVPVFRLPAKKPLASAMYTANSVGLLMMQKNIDVLHAYSLFSPLTTGVLAKQLLKKPIVVKVLRGGVAGDLYRMQRKRLGETRLRWFRNTVDRFICISSEIDAELDAIGVPAEKRVFIPNGVDVERFKPPSPDEKRKARLDLNLPENAPIAVFTGRLVLEKKVDAAIRIWPEIRAQFSEATLLIVGDGEMRARWESLAGEGVVFAGNVEDVTAHLAAADIFVLPSATEGLSNALLEAMATGLACVVTNVGGASDVITDGVNGRLVDPNDPAALYDALQALLANKDNIAQLSEGGLQKILSDYRLTVTADRLRALYEQVLNQKSSNS